MFSLPAEINDFTVQSRYNANVWRESEYLSHNCVLLMTKEKTSSLRRLVDSRGSMPKESPLSIIIDNVRCNVRGKPTPMSKGRGRISAANAIELYARVLLNGVEKERERERERERRPRDGDSNQDTLLAWKQRYLSTALSSRDYLYPL